MLVKLQGQRVWSEDETNLHCMACGHGFTVSVMSSFLWPSVFVKSALGTFIVRRKVVKIERCSTFGDLFEMTSLIDFFYHLHADLPTLSSHRFSPRIEVALLNHA